MNRPEAQHLVETFKSNTAFCPFWRPFTVTMPSRWLPRSLKNGGTDRKSFIKNLKSVSVPGVGSPKYQFDETGEGLAPPFITNPVQWYKDQQNQ
ncbi:MAG: hypothetical protein WBY88_00425 [Desulfosarcina sp.]